MHLLHDVGRSSVLVLARAGRRHVLDDKGGESLEAELLAETARAGLPLPPHPHPHRSGRSRVDCLGPAPSATVLRGRWKTVSPRPRPGILTWAQNGLHDFRKVSRNYHPNVKNGRVMLGVDVEALLWPESRWFAFGGHVSLGSYHQEQGLTAIASDRTGQVRSLLAVTAGWITNAGAGPHAITSKYAASYVSIRTRVDAGSKFGLGAAYNSGIFPGERELLVSLHVAIELFLFRLDGRSDRQDPRGELGPALCSPERAVRRGRRSGRFSGAPT